MISGTGNGLRRFEIPRGAAGLGAYRSTLREMVTVAFLPSSLKRWVYRRRGLVIDADVHFGPGAAILGSEGRIGRGARIGAATVIRARKFEIERGATIGNATVLAARDLFVGEDTEISSRVWVSPGTERNESTFRVGRHAIVMRDSYVNCLAPVTIGDNTGVGGECLLFTHGYWSNWFRGWPRTVAPIVIEKDVWLPWRVFILPGATIGEGSVIGAQSVVGGKIPPFSLAAGTPAKVIAENKYAGKLDPSAVSDRVTSFLQGAIDAGHISSPDAGAAIHVVDDPSGLDALGAIGGNDIVLSVPALPASVRQRIEGAGASWFDFSSWERSDRTNSLAREIVRELNGYGARFLRC